MSIPKILIIIATIAILGLLTGLGFRLLTNKGSVTPKKELAWGVTVLTFPFPTYKESFTRTQIQEAKKLGINTIRVDYVPTNPKASEVAVDEARKQKLEVVLLIPFGPKDIFSDKDLAANTDRYVTDIVNRFKGKVSVYQLATEAASVALNNDASKHGIKSSDYPASRLKAVITWVKTASETVKRVDPSAKRLVNDQWVHVGFFDQLLAEGADFDILGWNWFSDMGTTIDTVTLNQQTGETYQLLSKLESYNKPIWLTEVNRRQGSNGGKEPEQAAFITTMGDYVASRPVIKGFFVFNLLEDQAAPPQEKGYGIITATDNGKEQLITGHKAAFDAYKTVIKNGR